MSLLTLTLLLFGIGDFVETNLSWLVPIFFTALATIVGAIWHFARQVSRLESADKEMHGRMDTLVEDFDKHVEVKSGLHEDFYRHISNTDIHVPRSEFTRALERIDSKLDTATASILQRIDRIADGRKGG